MNKFKKQLMKSGFIDETQFLGDEPSDINGAIKYQLIHPFKEGHLQIRAYKEDDSVEVTIYNESGAELLCTSATPENWN